jgi:hypothetical protein
MAFGARAGGGRRADARYAICATASAATFRERHVVVIEDVSATGAKLSGAHLPTDGTEIMLKAQSGSFYASVVWAQEDWCGIQFEQALAESDLENLRCEAVPSSFSSVALDRRIAAEDWNNGLAR